MATMFDFGMIKSIFTNASIFGEPILVVAVVILFICVIITRDFQEWSVLALPIMLGLSAAGMTIPPISYGILGTLLTLWFIHGSMTLEGMGNFIRTAGIKLSQRTDGVVSDVLESRRQKKAEFTQKLANTLKTGGIKLENRYPDVREVVKGHVRSNMGRPKVKDKLQLSDEEVLKLLREAGN